MRSSKLSQFVRCLPEGDLTIAHSFKGGIGELRFQVPKGRPKPTPHELIPARDYRNNGATFSGFSRPSGTYPTADLTPAVNCRAILESPSGRRSVAAPCFHTPRAGDFTALFWSFCLGSWFFSWILSFELGASAAPAATPPAPQITASQSAFFENKIRPLLTKNCYKC